MVRRHASIGTWASVLWALVALSVITNSMLFALSSEQLAAWVPSLYRAATEADVAAGVLESVVDGAGATTQVITAGAPSCWLDDSALGHRGPTSPELLLAAACQVAQEGAGRSIVAIAVVLEHVVALLAFALSHAYDPVEPSVAPCPTCRHARSFFFG